jgi:hypothetical protein
MANRYIYGMVPHDQVLEAFGCFVFADRTSASSMFERDCLSVGEWSIFPGMVSRGFWGRGSSLKAMSL